MIISLSTLASASAPRRAAYRNGPALRWRGNARRLFSAIGTGLLVFFLAIGGATAGQQARPAPKPAQIDRNGVMILIRTTLIALDQANKTGNYTVLRDLGAPRFQLYNAAKLAEIFAKQRNDKLDLSGVAAIDPQLTILPQIEGDGVMHMAGFFPSVPVQVNFDLSFAPINGEWKLYGISVGVGASSPAPLMEEPDKAQASGKKK